MGVFVRVTLTMMLIVALEVAWLAYSVSATFENWPWTVRHTYRSGNFEGVTIGSTKADAMEQILLCQRQGTLDRVALIDDLGVLVAQEAAGGSLTVGAHWPRQVMIDRPLRFKGRGLARGEMRAIKAAISTGHASRPLSLWWGASSSCVASPS